MAEKNVYPYEHMSSWEKFNEESLPNKKTFYIKLNSTKDISDRDDSHTHKVWMESIWNKKTLVSIMTCMF